MTNMFFNHFQNQLNGNTQKNNSSNNLWGYDPNHDYSNDVNYNTPKQRPQQGRPNNGFDPQRMPGFNQNDMRAHAKPKWDTHEGAVNTGYTFTNYSVHDEGLKQASSGMKWNDPTNRVNNNYIEHWDDEYGWVKAVAVNGDLLKEGGKNVWNSDLHNTILEVEYDNGQKFLAGVYDHCGASTKEPKIDIWQYNSTPDNFTGKFTVKRKGGKTNYKKY